MFPKFPHCSPAGKLHTEPEFPIVVCLCMTPSKQPSLFSWSTLPVTRHSTHSRRISTSSSNLTAFHAIPIWDLSVWSAFVDFLRTLWLSLAKHASLVNWWLWWLVSDIPHFKEFTLQFGGGVWPHAKQTCSWLKFKVTLYHRKQTE